MISSKEVFRRRSLFLKTKLMSSSEFERFDAVNVKELILKSLQQQFGETGKSIPVDVLSYKKESGEVIIRCNDKTYNRVMSALLFSCSYKSISFYFKILQVSYSSIALTANSREYYHDSPERLEGRKRKRENHFIIQI